MALYVPHKQDDSFFSAQA